MNIQMRITGILVLALVALVTVSSNAYAQGPGDDGPVGPVEEVDVSQVLDLDYDDLWTEDFPKTVGSYNVGYINTPKNRACTSEPVVSLQATQSSLDEFLSNPPDIRALEKEIKSLSGVPSDFRISFSSTPPNTQAIADRNNAWYQERLERGCPEPWATNRNSDPVRSFVTFRNKDAGKFTDDNAQSVLITSPSEIGEDQDKWSAVLNNTLTDDDFLLQSGMSFDEDGEGLIGWTDDSVNLVAREFGDITFSKGSEYYFTNSYTNSRWWMCAGRVTNVNITPYQCVSSPDATGTHLKSHTETGVTFENANRNAGGNVISCGNRDAVMKREAYPSR